MIGKIGVSTKVVKMTPRLASLLGDAMAAGFEVSDEPNGTIRVVKKCSRCGKTLRGIHIGVEGTAIDVLAPVAATTTIRSYSGMRAILGIKGE